MLRPKQGVFKIIFFCISIIAANLLGIYIGQNYMQKPQALSRGYVPNTLLGPKTKTIVPEFQFKPGEIFHYKIISNGISVGKSSLQFVGETTIDDLPLYHIKFSTNALGTVDKEELFAHKSTFKPYIVKREITKLGTTQKLIEKYDVQKGYVAVYNEEDLTTPINEYRSENTFFNVILLFYYLRSQVNSFDENFLLKINLPTISFNLKFKGPDNLSTFDGKKKSFYFESDPKKFRFWIGADSERIPLKIMQAGIGGYALVLQKEDEN